MNDVSLVVGGEAGAGVRAAGNVLGKVFNKAGYSVFIRDDYPSLIQGGHNFSEIHISSNETLSQRKEIDILGAFDKETIEEHMDDLRDDGVIVINSDKVDFSEEGVVSLPISSIREEVDGPEIIENTAYVAAIAYLCGLGFEYIETVLEEEYGDKAGVNVSIAERIYEESQNRYSEIYSFEGLNRESKPLLTGNKSILLGAVSAGLDFYVAYPMTPSTSILHYAFENKDNLGLSVMQAENEIGVINIALGASYGGAKSMVGTSGGGYALMQETLSLAGMSETPIVIVNAQRAGPSTGVPTYTSQGDLEFARGAGHGEFPHIVLAPGDAEEGFYYSGLSLNLAWKFQVPVTLLSDKHLSESSMNAELDPSKINQAEPKKGGNKENYLRYKKTMDGVSPLKYPGNSSIVKATSYEHRENGYTTEEPKEIEEMQEKRLRKNREIKDYLSDKEIVKEFGENQENKVITWGSTKGSVLEAKKITKKDFSVLQPILMKPFPSKTIKEKLEDATKIISVENNSKGQLTNLVKEKTNEEIDDVILKYDMRPFYPKKLAKKLTEVL